MNEFPLGFDGSRSGDWSSGLAGNVASFALTLPGVAFRIGQQVTLRDVDGTPYTFVITAIDTDYGPQEWEPGVWVDSVSHVTMTRKEA